jgi:hypothetical protein
MNVGMHGDIYSDFEIDTKAAAPAPIEGKRGEDGRYVLKIDRSLLGAINGGGAEIKLQTFNGDIVLRKSR